MPELQKPCPHCSGPLTVYTNPVPTVDILITIPGQGIVLIERRNPPPGWAIPGGFIDYGESAEQAAIREALEETGLDVELTGLFGVYSDPQRDPRQHTISTIFTALARNPEQLRAGDDAGAVRVFPLTALPEQLAFDHGRILGEYRQRYLALNAPARAR
ncbi:NUDIX domain-containing protein [Desulfonatronum thioautotrophicum]|uniref:NUDIX domain-containing protein n=1 Tax=Desulfonatronum thioautotrophicum TaxID=617001 RepID=UPI0005EB84D2|nr:NUDIX hydrolase [Desulfonatronum thioautotrophicum]